MSWDEHSEKLRRLWEVFLVFTSGIFLLMCFGTPYWQIDDKESDKGIEKHSGLWACCYETGTTQTCYRNTPANCDAAGEYLISGQELYVYSHNRSRDCYTNIGVFGIHFWVVSLCCSHGVCTEVEKVHTSGCYDVFC